MTNNIWINVDEVLPVLEGDLFEDPDAVGGQPNRGLASVPHRNPALGREPPHHGRVLHVHPLKHLGLQVSHVMELVGQPEVVKLEGVGGQVEDVIFCPLSVTSVPIREG